MTSPLHVKRIEYRIADLLELRTQLRIDPPYQRGGNIWTRERQQLLIDSILNHFDVPPVYLHRLRPPSFSDEGTWNYAVIDGRQRLETLWDFASGLFPLNEEFVLLDEEPNPAALDLDVPQRYGGLRFNEFKHRAPHLHFRFLDYTVPISVVDTDDEALIEELFFRLNEGVPLTSAEKRNRGVVLRSRLAPLIDERRVFDFARITRRRRNLEDLLLRLLYLADEDASLERVPDLKKRQLDEFAASFRPEFGASWSNAEETAAEARLDALIADVEPVLRVMGGVFEEADPLVTSISTVLVYFLTFSELQRRSANAPTRRDFVAFNETIQHLRGRPESELTEDALDLMEQFDQPTQGSTTGSYLRRRAELLLRFLQGELRLES